MGSDLFFILNTPIKRNEQGDYALLAIFAPYMSLKWEIYGGLYKKRLELTMTVIEKFSNITHWILYVTSKSSIPFATR